MFVIVNGLAFWSVKRALEPFPVIADGLERIQQGDLAFRLPPLAGNEAHAIGAAFNRMAQAVQDKVQAERKAHDAEARLEERREMASLADQRVEEERRLIAHELHDEFGQSVTAIRSLALAIAAEWRQGGARDPATGDVARLISEEAARLYDAMHGLIPRLDAAVAGYPGACRDAGESGPRLAAAPSRRSPCRCARSCPSNSGPSITLAIYRVVQEGLINALRHAQASRVDIAVRCDARAHRRHRHRRRRRLAGEWARPGHFGLRGLAERVQQLGGTFNIGSQDGRGVRLTADIPLSVQA